MAPLCLPMHERSWLNVKVVDPDNCKGVDV